MATFYLIRECQPQTWVVLLTWVDERKPCAVMAGRFLVCNPDAVFQRFYAGKYFGILLIAIDYLNLVGACRSQYVQSRAHPAPWQGCNRILLFIIFCLVMIMSTWDPGLSSLSL